jgi:hypothetical protein
MKITRKKIPLAHIIDALDTTQGAYECLAATAPLIREPDKFAPDFCRVLLATKPPTLFQKKDGYYLVSGYREWQLALRLLDKTEKITCQVVIDVSTDLLKAIAWADAYGCMLLYGLSPKQVGYQLHQVIDKLDNDVMKTYFPELSKKAQLVGATDISSSALAEDKSKQVKPVRTFGDALKEISAKKANPKKTD